MVALNDYTVRFDLNKANALFPEIFSMYQAKIYPSNIDVARLELEEFGSGPFMLEEYLPNERIVLTRNPDYWDEGKPYLDKIVMLVIQEPATRAEALKNGDVDMIWMLQHQSAASLEAHSDTSVQEIPSASYLNLAMDVRTEPFDNVLVRRAFQAATDRQAILQAALAGKGGIASDHPIPSSDPNFNSECAPPAYDPELAKSLLAEAGYPDGIDQILYTSTAGPGMVEMAVAYKERAAAAGIRIDVQQMPEDAYWAKIWMVEPFVTVYWFGRNPDQALSIVYLSDGSWNESYYNNPTVDELILKARGQADDLGRAKTYGEVQCLLIDEVPRIIPVFQPMLNGVRNDVKGVQVHPRGYLVLVDAWLDR
jgi:peptide/nickel transport system substrate-binding protein